jgi:hypothetical protein
LIWTAVEPMAAGNPPFDGAPVSDPAGFGIKHRTSNAQHPTSNHLRSSNQEQFDVQCSMLNVRCFW